VIGSLGLTICYYPDSAWTNMLLHLGGHQAVRATGGRKLDRRTLSFHGYTGRDTVEPG
jgi:hypothetical protein